MSDRFFVDQPIASQPVVELAGAEAHHLIHVMRAQLEDGVTLFDGSGAEYAARITKLGRSKVHAAIVERRQVDREPPLEVTLGVALPKGDRQKWLVEKVVELGVTRIVPLHAERSVAHLGSSALERLRRIVVEASKQCGRNRLMQIGSPMPAAGFLETTPTEARRLLADPHGGPLTTRSDQDQALFIAIGPEGGFTDGELRHGHGQGWEVVSLGPRTLRIETAAIAIASSFVLPAASCV